MTKNFNGLNVLIAGLFLLVAPRVVTAAATIEWLGWENTGSRCAISETHTVDERWNGWIHGVEAVSRWEQSAALTRIHAEFDAKKKALLEEHRALSNRRGDSAAQDLGDSEGDFSLQVYANSLAQARLTLELNRALEIWSQANPPPADPNNTSIALLEK